MKKSILALAGIFSVGLLVLGLWGFIDNQMKIADSFSGHTRINGVDCSSLTVEETTVALTNEWNGREFVINSDGELVKSLRGLNFEYNISNSLKSVLVHNGMHPLLTWIAKGYGNLHIPMTISEVNPGFVSQVNAVRFVSQHDYKATKNAYVDMSTTAFPIIKEVYGNTTDKKKLLKNVLANIEEGAFVLDVTKSDYYVKPTILSDDLKLLAAQQAYLNNFAFKITYDFGYNSHVLTPKVISGMLQREGNSLMVRTDQVKSFIRNLAYRYDHGGMSRYFYDSTGTKVSVYGSDYGYLINQGAEVAWLTAALKNGKSARRIPEYVATARSHSNIALGTSYVEIDLTSQHLWIYRNGNLVLATPVVTGNVAKGTATPPGSYSIYFMQLNRILKGPDWDGTQYATPVAYWMAFYNGIGLHDAPWRYSFGGTIYKRNGSHGCVNMPPKMAAAAYSLLSVGYKVVVHY